MNHIAIMILNATSNLKECICMDLIGFEVSFSTVLFIFLPFIIQDKKNEYYLGYNISEWILYKRKDLFFLHHFSLIWLFNIKFTIRMDIHRDS